MNPRRALNAKRLLNSIYGTKAHVFQLEHKTYVFITAATNRAFSRSVMALHDYLGR